MSKVSKLSPTKNSVETFTFSELLVQQANDESDFFFRNFVLKNTPVKITGLPIVHGKKFLKKKLNPDRLCRKFGDKDVLVAPQLRKGEADRWV